MTKDSHPISILVVEDDVELVNLLESRLASSGFSVSTASTGLVALDQINAAPPDIVLLDVMLPELDGIEVCRRIRARNPIVYILMLTARVDEVDRVLGLESGADDYVTKPFSLQELVARVRSVSRRIMAARESLEAEQPVLEYPGLSVDLGKRSVIAASEQIHLTVKEFDLLLFLCRNPDRPFTRSQLLDKVWDIQYEGYDRTIDSHVQRLRSKIEPDSSNPTFIKTVWGVGYKFNSNPFPDGD